MDNVTPIRPARTIRVWFDREGWNVQMGALHKVFWKRHNASGFIDLLQRRHVAHVEVIGELPDE